MIEASMMDVTRTVEPEGECYHWVCRIRNCSTMKSTYDGEMRVSSLNVDSDIDTVIQYTSVKHTGIDSARCAAALLRPEARGLVDNLK